MIFVSGFSERHFAFFAASCKDLRYFLMYKIMVKQTILFRIIHDRDLRLGCFSRMVSASPNLERLFLGRASHCLEHAVSARISVLTFELQSDDYAQSLHHLATVGLRDDLVSTSW